MPRNLYADLGQYRRRHTSAASYDAADLAELERTLETASRDIDEHCERFFYALTATRYFAGDGRGFVRIPDLLSASTVKLDEDGDRVFELTLSSGTDYYLEREFADDVDDFPKTVIRLDELNGQRSVFPCAKRALEIAGVWGYTQETEAVAGTGTLADASTPTLTTSASGVLEAGQTLQIESEQVYVQAGSGTSWTVERGVNGTTAAAHAAPAMERYVYHPTIREAALKMAARSWERRMSGYSNVLQNADVGMVSVFRGGMDAEVERELGPFHA